MTHLLKSAFLSIYIGGLVTGILLAKSPDASQFNIEPSPEQDSPPEGRLDYQQCRQRALSRSQKLPKDRRARFLKSAVTQCREQYPAIAVLQECKREAFRAYRNHKEYLKSALEQCHVEYRQFVFNPALAIPIKVHKNDLYFAGIGLNFPFPISQFAKPSRESPQRRIGNFNCQTLTEVYSRDKLPEHILFGNDLKLYRPFQNVEPEMLRQAIISQSVKEGDEWIHPDWGLLSNDKDKGGLSHFFPVSYCHFDRDLGNLYKDIKIYYFLERERRAIIPYFGVAFFQPAAQITSDDLMAQLRKELGGDFQIQREIGSFQIAAAHPIDEVDSEGEPFNLCRHPRKHDKIAVIARHKDSLHAAYFLLSNLDNLCKHGDQLASRFLKQGL